MAPKAIEAPSNNTIGSHLPVAAWLPVVGSMGELYPKTARCRDGGMGWALAGGVNETDEWVKVGENRALHNNGSVSRVDRVTILGTDFMELLMPIIQL